jgi:hypothetical protein
MHSHRPSLYDYNDSPDFNHQTYNLPLSLFRALESSLEHSYHDLSKIPVCNLRENTLKAFKKVNKVSLPIKTK